MMDDIATLAVNSTRQSCARIMKLNCPACRKTIPVEDVALDAGWAKCVGCDELFELREILPGYTLPAAVNPRERPFDAWAILERKDRQLFVHLRAQGMRVGTWGLLTFATLWLALIAFWTLGALGLFFNDPNAGPKSDWFAAFSIPFWLVGLGILGAVVWCSRVTRTLYIDAAQMIHEVSCLGWRYRKVRDRNQVQHARKGELRIKSGDSDSQTHIFPVEIVFTGGSFQLPCANAAEQAWLVAEINDFLKTVPYDPRLAVGASSSTEDPRKNN